VAFVGEQVAEPNVIARRGVDTALHLLEAMHTTARATADRSIIRCAHAWTAHPITVTATSRAATLRSQVDRPLSARLIKNPARHPIASAEEHEHCDGHTSLLSPTRVRPVKGYGPVAAS
jgi:hypothetical protein